METSTPSDSSLPKLEQILKSRLAELKDLFASPAWHLFQEELARVRAQYVEHAVATNSSVEAENIRWLIRGLDLLRDDKFVTVALQEAGQRFDKPTETVQHYMALDSEGKHRLHSKEKLDSAH